MMKRRGKKKRRSKVPKILFWFDTKTTKKKSQIDLLETFGT